MSETTMTRREWLLTDRPQSRLQARLGRAYVAWRRFTANKLAVIGLVIILGLVFLAIFAPLLAPHSPYIGDLAKARLLPPGSVHWLGTDDQGRDILSAIFYGSRVSLIVGCASVLFSMVLGVALGLISGYVGGRLDSFIMRVADVQLSFPAILIALLVDGVARGLLPHDMQDAMALYVLIFSIGVSGWVQYARTVRGSTMVERNKEYVQAARVIGVPPMRIMIGHVLPNALGPVFVIGTINVATAIITEATLSFLGVGAPPTTPSLGTMISTGNNFLFSGEWWLVVCPSVALLLLCMSVNLLGDWLRDALNPRLQR